jgi:hypothetical protein
VRVVVADGTEMVFAKNAIARTVKPAVDEVDEPDELDESVGADESTDVDPAGTDDDDADATPGAKPATNPESADV